MISLASSFQRCQPRSFSITLTPTNPRRTFASTKFRRTSGELFWRNHALPVQMDTTLEFPSSSSTPWWGRSRESDVDSVIFPNSGEFFPNAGDSSPLWRALSLPSFILGRRWAHHRVFLVISFPFGRSRARLEVVPIESLSPFPSCSVAVTMTELQSACAAAAGEIRLPPSSPCVGEHLPAISSLSSLRFAPWPSP
jgi:hypothetical protein